MKICRYDDNRVGLVEGDQLRDISEILAKLPKQGYPYPTHDVFIERLDQFKPEMKRLAEGKPGIAVASVKLLSPVANPGKIVAAPVNYTKHLEEAMADKGISFGNPVAEIQKIGCFLKANSSLVGASASAGVTLTFPERRNDHEIELVAVVGKTARNVKAADGLAHIAGYCVGLDMTVRGVEDRSLRKSPDSYSVMGPWLVTSDELSDPTALELTLEVSGTVKQSANTRDLILGVAALVEFASSFYTLHPGDLIMTGTPQGVAPVVAGDVMTATIASIGTMKVAVR